MTVIVYRDNIMACDGGLWIGTSMIISNNTNKIHRLVDGSLFGAAGESGKIELLRYWLNKSPQLTEQAPYDTAGVSAILVNSKNQVYMFDNNRVFLLMQADWYAVGGPAEFVNGCLACGKSAKEAIELAIEWRSDIRGAVFCEALYPLQYPAPNKVTPANPDRTKTIKPTVFNFIENIFTNKYH